MSPYNQLSEEDVKRINEQRHKNRMMMAAIGLVLLVLLAIFSPTYKWIFVLGSFIVVIGMLFVRFYLEKQAQARHRAGLDDEPEGEEGN